MRLRVGGHAYANTFMTAHFFGYCSYRTGTRCAHTCSHRQPMCSYRQPMCSYRHPMCSYLFAPVPNECLPPREPPRSAPPPANTHPCHAHMFVYSYSVIIVSWIRLCGEKIISERARVCKRDAYFLARIITLQTLTHEPPPATY